MTKTLKKGLIAVLLLGLCFACAFLGFNTTRAFADLSTKEQKFVDDYAAFLELADANTDGELSADEIRDVMGTAADLKFMSMRMHVNNEASATEEAEYVAARAAYNDILAQYDLNGAALLYSNLTTRAAYIYTKTGYSYVNAAEVAEYRAAFDSMAGQDLAFLKNVMNWETTWVDTDADTVLDTPEQLVNAEAKIAQWKYEIDQAIALIKDIQVWDGAAMVPVYSALGYLAAEDYTVVLASEDSINNARDAYDTLIAGNKLFVEGSQAAPYTVNHLAVLTAAEEGLAVQKAKITAVEELIDTAFGVYSEEVGAEVCYTIYESHIKPAKDAYDDLDTSAHNNLKSGVNAEKKGNLDTMVATYEAVYAAIKNVDTGVEKKISDIPAATYTYAFVSKIDVARAAFEELPNDVKEAEEGTPGLYVENYQDLLDAEDDWADLVAEVETVIAKINALQSVEAENLYSSIIDMYDAYNGLTDKTNQLNGDALHDIVGVDPTELDEAFQPAGYIDPIDTCKKAYAYYEGLMNDIATAVNPIKTAIDALYAAYGEHAKFTNAFDAALAAITAQIDALPKVENGDELVLDPRYKGAIDNYDKYQALVDDYAALLALANDWADAVDEIGATVSVSNFDKVDAAVEKIATLFEAYGAGLGTDIAAFSKEYNSKAYSAYYAAYVAAYEKEQEIIGKLDDAKDAIEALERPEVADLDNYATFADAETAYTTYATAYGVAYGKVNALSAYDVTAGETITYFIENETYSAAYEALVTAFINVNANAIELEIFKIDAKSDEEEDYIGAAREYYDAVEDLEEVYTADDVQAAIRNYEVLTNAEDAVTAWIEAVEAILDGAALDGSDVAEIAVAAVTKVNVANGFFKFDVDAANTLKDTYGAFTKVEMAYEGVEDCKDLLDDAFIVAGVNSAVEGAKLYFIDQNIIGYYNAFNENTSLEPYPSLSELESYVAGLTASQRALLANVEKLEAVKGSQAMAKDLAAAIDTLYADVADGKVNAISAIEYYTISSIYNNLSVAKKDMVNAELAGDYTVAEAFEAIAAKFVDVELANVMDQVEEAIAAALEGEGVIEAAIVGAVATALENYVTTVVFNSAIAGLTGEEGAVTAAIAAATEAITTAYTNAIAALNTAITGEEGAIAAATAAITTAYTNAIAALNSAITGENGAIATAVAALNTAITGENGAIATAIAAVTEDYTNAIQVLNEAITGEEGAIMVTKTELQNKINAEKTARENADKAEKEAREAAVADLQAQIDALQNKTTIIIIAFAVVCAALCACVIVLFAKKKA